MSEDKIEKILATYKPVEGKPGYVWVSNSTIAELKVIREIYEKEFGKAGELYDENADNPGGC